MRLVKFLLALLICKVVLLTAFSYRDYFPPDFRSDFLRGRESHFFGLYSFAFYAHILSGPISLAMGLLLINQRFLRKFPLWHRWIGKSQLVCVVLGVVPSGLWMSWYAMGGAVAAAGFAMLAILTGATALLGWRAVMRREFVQHQRWMSRCFLLLCSAVVLRMIGGLVEVLHLPDCYAVAAWLSWLLPLCAGECFAAVAAERGRLSIRSSSGGCNPRSLAPQSLESAVGAESG